jgi:hypothetical protein
MDPGFKRIAKGSLTMKNSSLFIHRYKLFRVFAGDEQLFTLQAN